MAEFHHLRGFFAKILVLYAAVQKGLVWLVIVGIINSVIGLYYYLRILKVMYLDPAPETAGKIHFSPTVDYCRRDMCRRDHSFGCIAHPLGAGCPEISRQYILMVSFFSI